MYCRLYTEGGGTNMTLLTKKQIKSMEQVSLILRKAQTIQHKVIEALLYYEVVQKKIPPKEILSRVVVVVQNNYTKFKIDDEVIINTRRRSNISDHTAEFTLIYRDYAIRLDKINLMKEVGQL